MVFAITSLVCADDIQFYLEIILTGMMLWDYFSKDDSEESIFKGDFPYFCVVGSSPRSLKTSLSQSLVDKRLVGFGVLPLPFDKKFSILRENIDLSFFKTC